jgi:hypothetical protein
MLDRPNRQCRGHEGRGARDNPRQTFSRCWRRPGGRRLRGDLERAFECQAHVADVADALLRVFLEASSQ